MKNIFLLIVISFTICLSAQQAPTNNTQHQAQAQANELSLYKANIDDKIEAQDRLIAEASKRLEDKESVINTFIYGLTFMAAILTLIAAFIAIYAGFATKNLKEKEKDIDKEYAKLESSISSKISQLNEDVKMSIDSAVKKGISEFQKKIDSMIKDAEKRIQQIESTTQKADELLTELKDKLARGETPSLEEKEALKEKVDKIDEKLTAEDWFIKGLLAQNNKKYNDAILYYGEATKLNPNDPDILNNWGCALNNLNQTDEAIIKFEKAIEFNPENAFAYNNWGYTLNLLGQYELAKEKCKRSIDLNFQNPNAHKNLGNSYLGLGEYENAITSYSKAIKLKPDYIEAYTNLDKSLDKLKEQNDSSYPTLVDDFKKILETNKDEQELKNNDDFQALIEKYIAKI